MRTPLRWIGLSACIWVKMLLLLIGHGSRPLASHWLDSFANSTLAYSIIDQWPILRRLVLGIHQRQASQLLSLANMPTPVTTWKVSSCFYSESHVLWHSPFKPRLRFLSHFFLSRLLFALDYNYPLQGKYCLCVSIVSTQAIIWPICTRPASYFLGLSWFFSKVFFLFLCCTRQASTSSSHVVEPYCIC